MKSDGRGALSFTPTFLTTKRDFDKALLVGNAAFMVGIEAQRLLEQQTQARAVASGYALAVREMFGTRVRWIRLFGSLARGDWLGPEEADIDVAIVVDRRVFAEEMKLVDLASRLGWKHSVVLSPRIFSEEEFAGLLGRELRLAEDIMSEGVVL